MTAIHRHRFAVWIWTLLTAPLCAQGGLEPGTVYREFARFNSGNIDWRVTDPAAVESFAEARQFLPNPKLHLEVTDLKDAIRAELMLERWGGHRGTINKRIRVNGNPWIPVPELQSAPAGMRPEQLYFQDNPVVSIPLDQLQEGFNEFEAGCDELGGFGWGQWGIYSLVLRVYYPPGTKPSIHGQIVAPASGTQLQDNPTIQVQADAQDGVARIDVVAYYDGYDHDGDGVFQDWHHSRFQPARGLPNETQNHVGSLWSEPYELTWNTYWIPDQPTASIKLVARIQDARGYWTVTDPVEKLSLVRSDVSVKLYRTIDLTEDFGVRAGETKQCQFQLPEAQRLAKVVDAGMHFRSWHGWDGHHEPLQLNDFRFPIRGKNHFYDYDLLRLPPEALRSGSNTLTIRSTTEHHQLEVLWPGPAIVVRYRL